MALETLIKATDLTQWANHLDARGRLPLLLRRLIHATTLDIQRIGFPAEEGIQTPGFDGYLIVDKGNAFVPDGCSVWEMGANTDIRGKADSDYEKRCKGHLEVDPVITTYVFVTPRRWIGKTVWIEEKKKDGIWHDIRVYDADDLEQWIDLAPSVHIWMSILLGKHPKTAEDLTSFWENWSSATSPLLNPHILTIGREKIIRQVDEWLATGETVLTQNEAVAFLAAMVYQKPIDERIQWLSRILLVHDPETLSQLSLAQIKLILVPTFNPGDNVGNAIKNGHAILVPLGRDGSSSRSILVLPRQHVDQIKEALLALGIKDDQALSLAIIARRSLMAFRRKLAANPELHLPAWARPEHAREIIPALLLGKWDETKEGDRSAIARLANLSYEYFIAALGRWANESDPPVKHVGNIWLLTSKEDAWNLLSRYVNLDDLNKFESLVLDVLGETNPSLDLPMNERWTAALHGKVLSFSENLREGIADTLAIAGSQRTETGWDQSISTQEYVDKVVRKLLSPARKDWRVWSSLSLVLRLLAEASPNQFLDAINDSISGDDPILIKLFEEPEDVMFSGATYPGLLSALELLAWAPDYLSRVVVVLAVLARLDPGGRLGNRPSNSLKEMFLIWSPQTYATLEQRLRIIDMLRKHESVVAWKLMVDILPEPHSISSPSPTPRWRDWIPDTHQSMTWGELFKGAHETVTRLLEDVGVDGERWKTLIEHLASLPKEDANFIIERIERIDRDSLKHGDRVKIWASLRSLIARHKRYPNAQWALPSDIINRLFDIYEKHTPQDLLEKYLYLFSHQAQIIGDFGEDWKAHEKTLVDTRSFAVKELLEKGGINVLVDAATKVDVPYIFGITLGHFSLSDKDEDDLLRSINSSLKEHKEFLSGFIRARRISQGWDWVTNKIESFIRHNCTPEQQLEFFTNLPCSSQTIKVLDSFGSEIQEKYWLAIRPNPFEVDDYDKVIRALLSHKRPHVALDIVSMHIDKIGTQISALLTMECLEMVVGTETEYKSEWRVLDYINEILNAIEKTGEIIESRVASVEFALLPVLSHRDGRGPRILHKELSRNPEFFMEILSLTFRAEGEEKRELTEDNGIKTRLAHELIYGWRLIPGMQDNGSINQTALNDWVKEVREKAILRKRLVVADLTIGQVLSFSPIESDGTWPVVPIRELIEEIKSENLDRGLIIGVNNSRGVISKGLLDGGAQERDLAERYKKYANLIRDSWPRTASVLDKIAEGYLSDARREDLNAELEEDLWQ
jgi:hypothetical protein